MPKTITQDRARAIAEAYCTNGFHKKDALLAVGYKEPFSKSSTGSRMFDKPIIRAEIDAIMARNAEVCDVEVGEIIGGLRSIAFPSGDERVAHGDRTRALQLLGQFRSIFNQGDALPGGDEQEKELSESQKIEAEVLLELYHKYGTEIRREIEYRLRKTSTRQETSESIDIEAETNETT